MRSSSVSRASWAHLGYRPSVVLFFPPRRRRYSSGLKQPSPYAVIGAVIGEYIGANEGLGFFILYASQTYDVPSLFAGIILLVSIVFAVNVGLTRIERRIMRWRKAGPQALHI